MKEILHLILQCVYCWYHSFQIKTGAETWLRTQGEKENRTYPRGSQRNPRADHEHLLRSFIIRQNQRLCKPYKGGAYAPRK